MFVMGGLSSLVWTVFGSSLRQFLTSPGAIRAFNIAMALLLLASLYPVLMRRPHDAKDRVRPMSHSLLIAFVIFATVMFFTPGPNNIMLLSSGLTYGFRPSIPHIIGITVGFAFMVGVGRPRARHRLHRLSRAADRPEICR